MNADRSTPTPTHDAADPDADRALQRALADLPPAVDAARIEALNRRVLAQWQGAHAGAAAASASSGRGRGWLALQGGWRSPWLAGATGVALGLALVVGSWFPGSDPTLDELLQPDVLSQMAAGEM